MILFRRALCRSYAIRVVAEPTNWRSLTRLSSVMAPKRKAAVIDAAAAEADVVASTRRKLPRRSTQKVKEEPIEILPVIKSETKAAEKPVKVRTARKSKADAISAEDEVGDDDKTLLVVKKPPKVRAASKSKGQDVVEDGGLGDEDEALAVERGARRLPPVHSDILPLPWSGRLGYVRTFVILHHAHPASTLSNYKPGLPQHLPQNSQSARLFLKNMSNSVDPRAPASPPRPFTARACHEEQTRQIKARRPGTWASVCAKPRRRQCPRHCQDAALERQVRHQVYAPQQ